MIQDRQYFINYQAQRRIVGLIGLLLPFLLMFRGFAEFGLQIPSSVSAYIYTDADVLLTAGLGAVGIFLLAYRGPDGEDWKHGTVAGIGALGVAIFQTDAPALLPEQARCFAGVVTEGKAIIHEGCNPGLGIMLAENTPLHFVLHFVCAGIFLLTLGCLALFRFTKSDKPKSEWSASKHRSNRLYQICGIVIFLMIALVGLDGLLDLATVLNWPSLVFWLEAVAVWAFGIAWLVKGKAQEMLPIGS